MARVIPQELVKPAGERTSVRERTRQFEVDGGVSRTSAVEVPRAAPSDTQGEYLKGRRQTRGANRNAVHTDTLLCTSPFATGRANRESAHDSNEFETRPRGEYEGVLVAKPGDILSEMKDVKSELLASQGTGRCSGAQRKVR